jgi:4-amino-4-deoxy-L-arabinose transferase-like glycosyltransferase
MAASRRLRLALAFLFIVAVGAALRFYALDFGLPHPLVRPDEKEILLPSYNFARGDLNPKYHVYPGLYLYLVWLWGAAGLAVRRLFTPTPPYLTVLLKDIQGLPGGAGGGIFLIGRALSALAGTLTVVAVYVASRKRLGEAVALVAALLMATCFLHVRDSHALKAEALLTLMVVPALAACARVAEQPTLKSGLIAGVWIALATGMKQPGSLLLIPLYIAGVMGSAQRGVRRLLPSAPVWVGGLVAVALFLATSPFLILDFGYVRTTMGPTIGTVLAPSGGAPQPRALGYHLTTSFRHGTGILFSLLAAPATALGFFSGDALLILTSAFTVIWMVVIGVSPVHHVRYLTPALPGLAILIAVLLERVTRPIGRRAAAALAVAAVLVSAEPFAASLAHLRILGQTDTRVLASDWLAAHAQPGDEVAIVGTQIWPYGAPIMPPGVKGQLLPPNSTDLGAARFVVTHEHQLEFSHVDPAQLEALLPRLHAEAEFTPYSGPVPGGWFEKADGYYAPFYDFAGVTRPGPLIHIYSVVGATTRTVPPSTESGSAPPS